MSRKFLVWKKEGNGDEKVYDGIYWNFLLVLTIGIVVIKPGAAALAPLAVGAVLTAMIYAGGPISGAAFNPAVLDLR